MYLNLHVQTFVLCLSMCRIWSNLFSTKCNFSLAGSIILLFPFWAKCVPLSAKVKAFYVFIITLREIVYLRKIIFPRHTLYLRFIWQFFMTKTFLYSWQMKHLFQAGFWICPQCQGPLVFLALTLWSVFIGDYTLQSFY